MRIVAFDLSLSGTGWCASADSISWGTLSTKLRDIERMDWIARQCAGTARGASLVVMEDFSFGSRDSYAREIAGLSYMVRHWLWRQNMPYVLVAPASLKKFVTSRGNAEKSLVMKEVLKRWGHDCGDDNSADAVGLAYIGRALAGEWIPTTEQQREVVATLAKKYPKIVRREAQIA